MLLGRAMRLNYSVSLLAGMPEGRRSFDPRCTARPDKKATQDERFPVLPDLLLLNSDGNAR